MGKYFLWTSVLVLILFVGPVCVEACPGCKTLDDPIGKGFNWSVLFLMAMPFTVFACIGGTIFLHYRRAAQKPIEAETPETR